MTEKTEDQVKAQKQMFYDATQKLGARDEAFFDLMLCKENPLTNADLEALIKKRPGVYGRYSAFLGRLPLST